MSRRVLKLPSTSGLELHILPRKEWASLIFLPVWIAFWAFAVVLVMKWILHPGPSTSRGFLGFWLAVWILGGASAVYQWLWIAFGKEVVEVREGSLTIKRNILGYGGTRSVPLGSITNLRASGIFPSTSRLENYLTQMKLRGGTIGFECQGRTVRFGIQLTEPEALEVVQELKPWVNG